MSSELKESGKSDDSSLFEIALKEAGEYLKTNYKDAPMIEMNIIFNALVKGFILGYNAKEAKDGATKT